MQKHIREANDLLTSLGVSVHTIERTSRHVKFWVTYDGKEGMFVRSSTPSDARSIFKFKCDIKRWIKSLNNSPAT